MTKVTKGTRGFLSQISKKVLIEKELRNYINKSPNNNLNDFFQIFKNSFKGEKISTYMCNIYRNSLENDELDLLSAYFKKNIQRNSIFEVSSRCYIDNKLYHSLIYRNNKTGIDSYSVCFNHNNIEHFGKIVKFISINGGIFAIVQKYHIKKNYCDELPTLSGNYAIKKNFKIIKELFSKYFFCLNQMHHILKLVPVCDIICNCLIVYSEYDSFFTKLAYYFEHD